VRKSLVVTFVYLGRRTDDEFGLLLDTHVEQFSDWPRVKAMKSRRRRQPPTRTLGRVASHFTREGTPKNSYRTEREAQSAAQLAWTLNGADLNAYRCDYCHQWHMGKRFRDD
jgi:hypothetical protein